MSTESAQPVGATPSAEGAAEQIRLLRDLRFSWGQFSPMHKEVIAIIQSAIDSALADAQKREAALELKLAGAIHWLMKAGYTNAATDCVELARPVAERLAAAQQQAAAAVAACQQKDRTLVKALHFFRDADMHGEASMCDEALAIQPDPSALEAVQDSVKPETLTPQNEPGLPLKEESDHERIARDLLALANQFAFDITYGFGATIAEAASALRAVAEQTKQLAAQAEVMEKKDKALIDAKVKLSQLYQEKPGFAQFFCNTPLGKRISERS